MDDFDAEEARALIAELHRLDPDLRMFGASTHRYRFREPLGERELAAFEAEHGVTIPDGFRRYLSRLGNGGAGPFYGILPLGHIEGGEWEEGDGVVGQLAEAFPHAGPWNLPDELGEPPDFDSDEAEFAWHEKVDRVLYAPRLMNGAFPICEHGDAYRTVLVVSGPERGRVWFDGRAGGLGIKPHEDASGAHLSFGAWFVSTLLRRKQELIEG